jgi:hypothetical protein
LSQAVTLTGTEQAVIAHLLKPFRQDVLQEAPDELFRRQGAAFPVTTVALSIAKGDLTVVHFEDTVVAESHSKDVRGQILQGGLTDADRLAVGHPLLSPDMSGHLRQ